MNNIRIERARVVEVKNDELKLTNEGWLHPRFVKLSQLAGFSKPPEVGDIIAVFIGSFTGAIVYAKGIPAG
jgi:hypothetical protein